MVGLPSLSRLRKVADAASWGDLVAEAWAQRPPRYRDDRPLSWTTAGCEALAIEWPARLREPGDAGWVESIRLGLAAHVTSTTTPIPQPWHNVVAIGVIRDGRRETVAIDYDDETPINPTALSSSRVYFKMQFAAEGYDDPRVVPGGFPPYFSSIFRMLTALRKERDRRAFDTDVTGRFSVGWATEIRTMALELLGQQRAFTFEGGSRPARYSAFLRQVARSKVGIDLPGRGPFCFRLVDYLAVGTCIVAVPHSAAMPVPLEDGVHLVYASPDLSDLVTLCAQLVEDDDERDRLAANARAYFDQYLTPRQIGAYYVRTLVDALT
jgi:hypothetical protein